MKKRACSLLMAVVILFGVMSVSVFPVSAETDFHASAECIGVLKEEEGFNVKPYWDYSQYTVGYGTYCPPDMVDYYTENGITEAEAEEDWSGALETLEDSYLDWQHRWLYLHIVSSRDVADNAESMYLRAIAFAKTEEITEFRAELSDLQNQLRVLRDMESFNLRMIF